MSKPEGEAQRESTRPRKHTEAGHSHQIDIKSKTFKKSLRDLQKNSERILQTEEEEDEDPSSVRARQDQVKKWCQDYTTLLHLNTELKNLLSVDLQVEHDTLYASTLRKLKKTKIFVQALLHTEDDQDVRHQDERQDTETGAEPHSQPTPSLRLHTQDGGASATGGGLTGATGNSSTYDLSHALAEQLRRSMLPTLEPEIFRGQVEQFGLWVKAFESYIETRTSSPSERLHYLAHYTGGEAREAIQGYLMLGSEEAYDRAKQKLVSRYGSDFVTANRYRQKLREWPCIKTSDGRALQQLADFLETCELASHTVRGLSMLDDLLESSVIFRKLPKNIVERWQRVADNKVEETGRYPSFSDFVKFLAKEARVALKLTKILQPEETRETRQAVVGRAKGNARTFLSSATSGNTNQYGQSSESSHSRNQNSQPPSRRLPKCGLCSAEHTIETCDEFKRMSLSQRQEVVKNKRLCRGCLRFGHVWRECKRKQQCQTCGRLHPTLLHDETFIGRATTSTGGNPDSSAETVPKTVATTLQLNTGKIKEKGKGKPVSCVHTMIVPVMVRHEDRPEHEELTYALLDNQSDACFITDNLRKYLKADGEHVHLELSTITGKNMVEGQAIRGLVIRPLDEKTDIKMPVTYTRTEIPASHGFIPRPETARRWPHLQEVAKHLHPYCDTAEIGLLIGINCPKAVRPKEVVSGADEEPWAVKTDLGWSVVGGVQDDVSPEAACHYVSVGVNQTRLCHYAFRLHARVITPAQLAQVLDAGLEGEQTDSKMSHEDHMFLKIMKDGTRQGPDGHFTLPIPLKDEDQGFPNNREAALQRLESLKKRLSKNEDFREDYSKFMADMLNSGYAEEVPEEEVMPKDRKVWYVPHHGVYHPKKNKVRIVFDCSHEFKGVSLNSRLLQGPISANNMTAIILRFRKHPIAVSCDIEGMFQQVKVPKEHKDLLRFLWWKDADIRAQPTEYRMKTHLFGATSSPACAMYALSETANRYEDEEGTEAADFIRDNFYVDDGLVSCTDAATAASLVRNTIKLCDRGGFKLHKFVSNGVEVLKSLPKEYVASSLQGVDLSGNHEMLEHALGIKWDVKKDEFRFDFTAQEKPHTRRGILSVVSSIYDPVGFVSPFVMLGKVILKELCCSNSTWDEPIPKEMDERWMAWKADILQMAGLSVPRCFQSGFSGVGTVKLYELHHFSDASFDGYGQCSYIRVIGEDGEISCNLLMSKTRVTPKRTVTMPRLELMAAVTSVKVSCLLRQALTLPGITDHFWTDSQVVLGYITNESKRFHVFVSNRIQTIRDHTSPAQWRYIESANNPADMASRGVPASALMKNRLWWNGPSFLKGAVELPECDVETRIRENDPEVKGAFCTVAAVKREPSYASLPERLTRFSSWYRARRAVALCLRYRKKLLNCVRLKSASMCEVGFSSDKKHLTVAELKEAEATIIRSVQQEAYGEMLRREPADPPGMEEDMKSLHVKKSDALYRLDPIRRKDGLIGVGGRMRRASVPMEVAHPVILPNKGHVTDLLVSYVHERTGHSGREMTLSEIRQKGYWVIRGRSAVQRHILKCVKCKRMRGVVCNQKMADLPSQRLEPAPPFTYTGVDAFGPFFVRQQRSQIKRWGLIFTCFNFRAIHLEVVNSLTADSFINAYRRFVCRRGPVRRLYCDNGTNFVGGKSQLEAALSEQEHDAIRKDLIKEECDWVEFRFNPPHSSHMGGIWERQIRSARAALCSLIDTHGHQLDDELLLTIMAEAEAIVNSRPLTYTSMTDTDTVEPISPSQLLTLKSKVVLPTPGTFCQEDVYARRRWRRVQLLANSFWQRWRREFLPTLQKRDKWQRTEPNVKNGDVVVVIDDDTPRGRWPLGRIVQTYPSDDGLVRKVRVRVGGSEYDRPVHRLIVLVDNEGDSQSGSSET